MAGSGAGSNLVNLYLLGGDPTGMAVSNGIIAAPSISGAAPLAGYGTIGYNDSGWWCVEARAFTKWTFTLESMGADALTGVQVTLYGAVSPAVAQTFWNAIQGPRNPSGPIQPAIMQGHSQYGGPQAGAPIQPNGMTNATGYVPGIQPWMGFVLPAPAEQSGTGPIANPMSPTTPVFTCNIPLVGIRAVVTGTQTGGAFAVSVLGIP